MNKRIHKKLSKRASKYLHVFGDKREIYKTEKDDEPEVLKGTHYIGSLDYYSEWNSESCWFVFMEYVFWYFAEVSNNGEVITCPVKLKTPSDYFKAMDRIIEETKATKTKNN